MSDGDREQEMPVDEERRLKDGIRRLREALVGLVAATPEERPGAVAVARAVLRSVYP